MKPILIKMTKPSLLYGACLSASLFFALSSGGTPACILSEDSARNLVVMLSIVKEDRSRLVACCAVLKEEGSDLWENEIICALSDRSSAYADFETVA